ncbi:predicted protein [Nematostella vectensis]|uniref:Uncharacterized protein n=1 Tax=Nematostella vectensis TaxID=45351 RepID=A7RNH3_NEMVE|nr:uncharacterized protein LOC5519005 [Nematostella vectensis]EDO46923.1 predicted protein [Nematostella vectensis]|eukprot:XP_001638986.1 predicted protein [Nematostella vectensis]
MMGAQPTNNLQSEMVKRIQGRPCWQHFSAVVTVAGFTLLLLYKLWSIHGRRSLALGETSVLVQDQRGSGLYLTLKLRCYYCDTEDYGPTWKDVMSDKTCQDTIMSQCYANQTTGDRKVTKVVSLIRACVSECTCSDEENWCSPEVCGRNVQCCWRQVYCNDEHEKRIGLSQPAFTHKYHDTHNRV